MGQVDSSLYYAKKGLNISKQESLTPKILDATSLLTELYIPLNTDSAFKYQQLMLAAKDSLFSEEKVKQMQNLSFNEKLRQQEVEAARQKYSYRIRMNAFLGSTFTLIVIAILLFIIIRRKQKAKQKIESAYDKLKETQEQLIQAEKMASLGELTAGIAHEIQNPLNFVNNFSDLNKELLVELKAEADKGELGEVKTIANDLIDNEDKINHHGRRAESIVKGMLLHSRGSNGQKELTDINALADEYLRLSYHGFRAKDKSFNANFKLEADESLPKINVVPQDIGRVILNLINNAFYAVSEKLKQNGNSFKPLVVLSVSMDSNNIKITVKDNGNGIPNTIKDKIFQPFYTTKPTGVGTGLGLSLSYDIIKKGHNGELKVNSVEGSGTEFIILIPIEL